MRKKALFGLGLLVAAAAAAYLFLLATAPGPIPLPSEGMTLAEVLKGPVAAGTGAELPHFPIDEECMGYATPEDAWGRGRVVIVYFSKDGRVTRWSVLPRRTGWASKMWELAGQ
mgnify:CR=1 FL=1